MFENSSRHVRVLVAMAACGAMLTACNDSPLAPVQAAPATVTSYAHGGGGIAGGPVAITACNDSITAPGKYALATDLSGCTFGITIVSSDVTLNLGGHTVSGLGTGGGIGLDVVLANNVSILNGTFTNFAYGVEFEGVTGSRMSGVTATGNHEGFVLNADFFRSGSSQPPSEGNAFYDNVFNHNNDEGIDANGAVNNKFRGNQADYNGHAGLYFYRADGNDVKDNEFSNNAYSGVNIIHFFGAGPTFSIDNIIQSNTALNNGAFDMADEWDTPQNTWIDNTFQTTSRTFIH